MEIISFWAGIVGVPTLLSIFLKRYFDKRDQRDKEKEEHTHAKEAEREKREEVRTENLRKENIIIMKSIRATGALSRATAKAMQRGYVNGDTQAALDHYDIIEKEMDDFLLERTADNVHGEC